jgi:hypothetical protein
MAGPAARTQDPGTCDVLEAAGAGDRLRREGLVHGGIVLQRVASPAIARETVENYVGATARS